MSVQNFFLKKYLRHRYKPRLNDQLDLNQARLELDSVINDFMPAPSRSVQIRQQTIGGVPCECITPKRGALQGTFLYLHGGMFAMGSSVSHRGVTCELAKELSLQVIVPNYRLAPEYPYPAAVEDVQATYLGLFDESIPQGPLIVGGDQAGACLAMLLAVALRDSGYLMPDLLVGISGLYDLTLSSDSLLRNRELDCCNTPAVFKRGVDNYLTDPESAATAEVSPLLASLEGLPPVMLQVSDSEMLLDDSYRLADALEQAGGKVLLDIWDDMPTCWHLAAVGLPEGRSAIKRIGKFINKL